MEHSLQIDAEPVHLLQHEVHVLLGDRLVGDDRPEEVGLVVQRLVAHHQVAGVHHPGAVQYSTVQYSTVQYSTVQ